MLRHDDVLQYLNHGVMGGDAGEQLLLYHLANGREGGVRSAGVAVGFGEVARNLSQRLVEEGVRPEGDMIGARVVVVVD